MAFNPCSEWKTVILFYNDIACHRISACYFILIQYSFWPLHSPLEIIIPGVQSLEYSSVTFTERFLYYEVRLRKQSKKEKAWSLSHTPWIRFKSIMQTHTVCSTSRPIFTAKTKKSIWKWGLRWSGNIDGQKWSRSSQMEQSEVIVDEKWKAAHHHTDISDDTDICQTATAEPFWTCNQTPNVLQTELYYYTFGLRVSDFFHFCLMHKSILITFTCP